MISINGRDVEQWLTTISRKIVKTYKGDIERNQLGDVIKFPAAFFTLGFDLIWTGPRAELDIIHQLLLASDQFRFVVYGIRSNDYSGDFSATTTSMEDLKDKNEAYAILSVSIVNVKSDIKDGRGNSFVVSTTSGLSVVSGAFGELVTIPSAYLSYRILNPETQQKGGTLPSQFNLLGNLKIEQ